MGAALEDAGTLRGSLIFLALWGVSVWTTARALRGVVDGARLVRPASHALAQGIFWGAAAGLLFLAALVLLLAAPAVVQAGGFPPDALVGVVLFLGLGGAIAFGIGAVTGALLSLLDLAMLRVALLLHRT